MSKESKDRIAHSSYKPCMRFSVLSSGSKANSTVVESHGRRILIDCGLSCRQTEARLSALGIDPGSIEGIIVTHEHADHISGIPVFLRKHKIPLFVNDATSAELTKSGMIDQSQIVRFETGEPFEVAGIEISPFSIIHDAVDPVGFILKAGGLKFTHVTDLGKVTPLVTEAAKQAHALVLESNHDLDMLFSSEYPWELKQRINSSHGHLSNDSAGELLKEILHSELMHVVLGHLSENCNTPQRARSSAQRHLGDKFNGALFCAGIEQSTALIEIGELTQIAA